MKPQTIVINDTRYKLVPDTQDYHNLLDRIYYHIEDDGNMSKAEKLQSLHDRGSSYQDCLYAQQR